jgi:hypothetical protein
LASTATLWATAAACGGTTAAPPVGTGSTAVDSADGRCVVRLHGKGDSGRTREVDDAGVTNVWPDGNAEGWGGRQWLYFPDDRHDEARAVVVDAAASCDEVIINGFSNGASFAAKLYCRGEDLGGRLVRVVVDDPVTDAAVMGCEPSDQVGVALYWTGALEPPAVAGWDCAEGDWTCEGGSTLGIEAYADALGTEVLASVHRDHQWYLDAPALADWSRPGT